MIRFHVHYTHLAAVRCKHVPVTGDVVVTSVRTTLHFFVCRQVVGLSGDVKHVELVLDM